MPVAVYSKGTKDGAWRGIFEIPQEVVSSAKVRIEHGYGFSQLTLSASPFPELQQLEVHAFSILPRAEIDTSAHTTPTSH